MECQPGYKLTNGNSARTCLETGQWNGTNITCTGNVTPICLKLSVLLIVRFAQSDLPISTKVSNNRPFC